MIGRREAEHSPALVSLPARPPGTRRSQERAQRRDERQVHRDPRHVEQLVRPQPPVLVVVDQRGLALGQRADVHPQHGRLPDQQVAAEPRPDRRLDLQLLAQLAPQRLLVALARLDLATGELPQPGQPWRLGPAGREHAAVAHERRTDDPDPVHGGETRPVRTPLTADELAAALRDLPHWSGDLRRLSRTVVLDDAARARIAAAADALDHHPVLEPVEGGSRLVLWTHVRDAVTELDVALARRIDELL